VVRPPRKPRDARSALQTALLQRSSSAAPPGGTVDIVVLLELGEALNTSTTERDRRVDFFSQMQSSSCSRAAKRTRTRPGTPWRGPQAVGEGSGALALNELSSSRTRVIHRGLAPARVRRAGDAGDLERLPRVPAEELAVSC